MRPRSILVALVLLVALGSLWLLLQQREERGWQDPGFAFPVLTEPVRFVLERDDERIVLVRRGEQWHIEEPIDFPAARFPVENLERLFSEPLVIDLSRDPAQAERLGLGTGAPRLEVEDASGEIFSVRVGNAVEVERTARTLTWLQPEEGAGIYRVGLDAGRAVQVSLNDLRERRFVHLTSDDVVEVVLEQGDERTEIVRVEDTWYFGDRRPAAPDGGEADASPDAGDAEAARRAQAGGSQAAASGEAGASATAPIPESERPVPSRVRTLVNALAALRATEFADELTWESAGLSDSALRATLRTREGEEVTLVLGPPVLAEDAEETSDTLFPIGVEGAPHIYRVRQSVANHLRTDRETLLPDDTPG